jgi:hypothetical protein
MKQIFLFAFFISCLFQSACTEQIETSQNSCTKYVELNFSNYNSLKTDPLSLISAKIDGDCLLLTLQYGGGCKEHQIDLALIQPECGTPPLPPPTFEIRHNANDDVCKALITKEYSFDISGIRENGKNKIDFVLNTRSTSGITSTITYTYAY